MTAGDALPALPAATFAKEDGATLPLCEVPVCALVLALRSFISSSRFILWFSESFWSTITWPSYL